jgi:hypothetical protein
MTHSVKVELSCDFDMLAEQYQNLLNVIEDLYSKLKIEVSQEIRKEIENKIDNLYGLVHFVEVFQDRASDILGEQVVFGNSVSYQLAAASFK